MNIYTHINTCIHSYTRTSMGVRTNLWASLVNTIDPMINMIDTNIISMIEYSADSRSVGLTLNFATVEYVMPVVGS